MGSVCDIQLMKRNSNYPLTHMWLSGFKHWFHALAANNHDKQLLLCPGQPSLPIPQQVTFISNRSQRNVTSLIDHPIIQLERCQVSWQRSTHACALSLSRCLYMLNISLARPLHFFFLLFFFKLQLESGALRAGQRLLVFNRWDEMRWESERENRDQKAVHGTFQGWISGWTKKNTKKT